MANRKLCNQVCKGFMSQALLGVRGRAWQCPGGVCWSKGTQAGIEQNKPSGVFTLRCPSHRDPSQVGSGVCLW